MIFLGLNIVSGRWSICMDRASARFSFGSLLLVALDIATSWRASSKTLWYKTCLRLRKSLNSDSWLLYSVYDPSPPLCSCDTTGSPRPGRGKSTKALKLDEIKMGNIIIKIKYFSNSLNLIVLSIILSLLFKRKIFRRFSIKIIYLGCCMAFYAWHDRQMDSSEWEKQIC